MIVLTFPMFFIVCIYRTHYPGTLSTKEAVQTNLKLWASEDYSTYNDNVGAGCWARVRITASDFRLYGLKAY